MIFTIYDSTGTYPVGVTANNEMKVALTTVAADAVIVSAETAATIERIRRMKRNNALAMIIMANA